MLDSEGDPTADGSQVFQFSVTFLELLGRRASDLVRSGEVDAGGEPKRVEIAIRENKVIIQCFICRSIELTACLLYV